MGWYQEILGGQRTGPAAALVRGFFYAVSIPYGWAVRYRNWRFDTGRATIFRLPVPVVSVGNLTLGGTGKTPMAAWLARWFQNHGVRVGVISRGYKAQPSRRSDEALELQRQVPGLIHVENPDRVWAGREAVEKFSCQVLVADDAFQHRRLARDLDLVLMDAAMPFGLDHLFPRGFLREPVEGLRRADAVVLSRSDMVDPQKRSAIRERVLLLAPRAVWVEAVHVPFDLVNAQGQTLPLEALAGRSVAAFCGIGHPAGFLHTLRQCGYQTAAFRELPDHCPYPPRQIAQLADWVRQLDVAAVVCTLKDLIKIPHPQLADRPLWAVRIGLQLLEGRSALENLLSRLLPQPQHGKNGSLES